MAASACGTELGYGNLPWGNPAEALRSLGRSIFKSLETFEADKLNRFELGRGHLSEKAMQRQELLVKLGTSLAGLGVSFLLTYYGIKWLMDHLDPTKKEKKLSQKRAEQQMEQLGLKGFTLTEYEMCIAANLVDPLAISVSWNDIGGLEGIASEIKETVIVPFRRPHLFGKSSLLRAPKGVLLYGPPGCGKTMIAKATAKAAGARFINLQVSSLFDKWYGESQKRAEAIFSLAAKIQPTIIFIDEIDSFLRSRASHDHESTAMIKAQFMSLWDGLLTDSSSRIMIMGATNRASDLDAAILRRMPCTFNIKLPVMKQREKILQLILKDEQISDVEQLLPKLARQTEGFSGSDLTELCRHAAVSRIREYLEQEKAAGASEASDDDSVAQLRPMCESDFDQAIKKMMEARCLLTGATVQLDLD